MWATPSGVRVLVGAERKLFVDAVSLLFGWLDEFQQVDTDLTTGAHLFDALPLQQKMAMLDSVAGALLREDVPAPDLTAIREATIGGIYRYLVSLVEIEIDDKAMQLRSRIVAAAAERGLDEYPNRKSTMIQKWSDVIEQLSMEILWDIDWDLDPRVLDLPPQFRRDWGREHGIGEDYFSDVALDPNETELGELKKRLSALGGEPTS